MEKINQMKVQSLTTYFKDNEIGFGISWRMSNKKFIHVYTDDSSTDKQ